MAIVVATAMYTALGSSLAGFTMSAAALVIRPKPS